MPLLGLSQNRKHLELSNHYMNNWGLVPGNYLLINYDENWFGVIVIRRSTKSCAVIVLDTVYYNAYHSSHIKR